MINVSPREMATAEDVELFAEVAIADMRLPQVGGDVQNELDRGKAERQTKCRPQSRVHGTNDGGMSTHAQSLPKD